MTNKQGNNGDSGPNKGVISRRAAPTAPTTRAGRKAAKRRGQIRRATAKWRAKLKAAVEAKALEEARAKAPRWRRPWDPVPAPVPAGPEPATLREQVIWRRPDPASDTQGSETSETGLSGGEGGDE